ncbi:MAG: XrtA/PEP-CTERM system-associated ATPase, partial [Vicinamibacterales bacterium]
MYERFYNLRERPFSLSPDPDYLYPSRVHKEALSYLRYGIEGHAGFIVVTGEIGSGKTTLLQTALRGLDHRTSVSRIVNTMLDARELIEAVMLDFGIDPGADRSKPLLLRDLARYLVEQRGAGRLALLVIDEAQNLSLAALEEVRMLSNLETEKSKLIQIALVGQPSLREVLNRPELEQLRQRVTVSYHLQALDTAETAAYVNHRLRRAAVGAPLELSRDVTDLIHLHSRGIPRKINVIADAVLLFGYGEEQRTIGVDLTQEAIEELEATGVIQATPHVPAGRPVQTPRLASASREEELLAREVRLNERERQISEQQRVLNEEYRLLRLRAERPGVDSQRQTDWPWPPAPSDAPGTGAPSTATRAPASAPAAPPRAAAAPGRSHVPQARPPAPPARPSAGPVRTAGAQAGAAPAPSRA